MDNYTLTACRLAEKRLEDNKEYELNNLRLVLTSIINTTAQKKKHVKKPEDIMRLKSDDIRDYKRKKKVVKVMGKKEARKHIEHLQAKFDWIQMPKHLDN